MQIRIKSLCHYLPWQRMIALGYGIGENLTFSYGLSLMVMALLNSFKVSDDDWIDYAVNMGCMTVMLDLTLHVQSTYYQLLKDVLTADGGPVMTRRAFCTGMLKGLGTMGANDKILLRVVPDVPITRAMVPILALFFGLCYGINESCFFAERDHRQQQFPTALSSRCSWRQPLVVLYAVGENLDYSLGLSQLVVLVLHHFVQINQQKTLWINLSCMLVMVQLSWHAYDAYEPMLRQVQRQRSTPWRARTTGLTKALATVGATHHVLTHLLPRHSWSDVIGWCAGVPIFAAYYGCESTLFALYGSKGRIRKSQEPESFVGLPTNQLGHS